jgi:flagellar biosynthesis protein FlhG
MGTARASAGRILSVGGGKGGVGKSVIAANLAICIARTGAKTVLVDADLGAANLHTLFDVQRATRTLNELFTHEINSLGEAAIEVGIPNLQLIAGSSATPGAANLNHAQKLRLLRQIQALSADVVIVDVGAGVSFNVVDLFDAADFRLLVVTPQLTSVQNAYGFLKSAVFRVARQIAAREGRESAFDGAGETQKLPAIIQQIRASDSDAADSLDRMLISFGARMIGNHVFEPAQRNTFYALSRMVADFLGTPLPLLGSLRASRLIHDSVSRRRPFAIDSEAEESNRVLRQVAEVLLRDDPEPHRIVRQHLSDSPGAADEPTGDVPLESSGESLPVPLDEYGRLPTRYPVSWQASLDFSGTSVPVRVEDISLAGARLSGAGGLSVNRRCEIIFAEFTDRLPAVVRYADGRDVAGIEFLGGKDVAAKLVAAAQARAGTPAGS